MMEKDGIMELWSDGRRRGKGLVECWSDGKKKMVFLWSASFLHYSSPPILHP
jgi:hypothetical protein